MENNVVSEQGTDSSTVISELQAEFLMSSSAVRSFQACHKERIADSFKWMASAFEIVSLNEEVLDKAADIQTKCITSNEIEFLLHEIKNHGLRHKDLASFLGLSASSVSKMKERGGISKDQLPKVRQFLHDNGIVIKYPTLPEPNKFFQALAAELTYLRDRIFGETSQIEYATTEFLVHAMLSYKFTIDLKANIAIPTNTSLDQLHEHYNSLCNHEVTRKYVVSHAGELASLMTKWACPIFCHFALRKLRESG